MKALEQIAEIVFNSKLGGNEKTILLAMLLLRRRDISIPELNRLLKIDFVTLDLACISLRVKRLITYKLGKVVLNPAVADLIIEEEKKVGKRKV